MNLFGVTPETTHLLRPSCGCMKIWLHRLCWNKKGWVLGHKRAGFTKREASTATAHYVRLHVHDHCLGYTGSLQNDSLQNGLF